MHKSSLRPNVKIVLKFWPGRRSGRKGLAREESCLNLARRHGVCSKNDACCDESHCKSKPTRAQHGQVLFAKRSKINLGEAAVETGDDARFQGGPHCGLHLGADYHVPANKTQLAHGCRPNLPPATVLTVCRVNNGAHHNAGSAGASNCQSNMPWGQPEAPRRDSPRPNRLCVVVIIDDLVRSH